MSEERGTARRGHRSRRGPRRPRTGTVIATVLAVALGGFGWAATRSPGYTTDHLEANDGTLWVTNDRAGLFGRLNAPAAHLDAALAPSEERDQTYQLDVVQSGASVLTRDRITGKVVPVDVRAGSLVGDRTATVPPASPLAVGSGTSVVVDPDSGDVRAASSLTPSVASVDGLDTQVEPLATVPIAPEVTGDALTADVAVDGEGTAYAAGSGGRLLTLRPTGDGRFSQESQSLGGALQDAHLVLTPDGPVVLDTVAGVIARPGGERVTVRGQSLEGGVPVERTTTGDLLVATPRALLSVTLESGDVRTLAGGGTGPATAPVVLDGCTYAAWSGSPGRVVKSCGGAFTEVRLTSATNLLSPHLRVNHRSVALNDSTSGGVWSLDDGARLDDWAAVAPPSSQSPPKDPDQSTTVDRSSKPPRAVDDTVGARPGRTSTIHVLDNDVNPSGSVLSVTRVSGLPQRDGSLAVSPDGQTVQLVLASTASATSFEYVIDDGRGNSSSARVSVEVRAPSENGAPTLRPNLVPTVTSVSSRGSVGIPVVGDWRDPDSDPVAVTKAADGEAPVALTADGRLRYTAPAETGPRTIEYTVSDGTAETVGRQSVDVLADTARPIPATPLPDVGRGEVGKPVVLRPLDNDVPGTDPATPAARLQLAGNVTAPDGTTVVTSIDAGTVSITAGAPGTYLLSYPVRFGDAPIARGAIRVDVRAATERPGRITAMPDQVVVRGQTATIVDVLANDVDPAGGLLVVQGIETESSDAVEVAVLRGRWLRIAATRPALRPNPVLVSYTVTNGQGSTAEGAVSVLQLPEPEDVTPIAVDDTATVRSGDHVSIPVLDNDIDPTGATLRLSPQVEGSPRAGTLPVGGPDGAPTSEDVGAAYVAGTVVRFQAPEVTTQQTVAITYVVEGAGGKRATGLARVSVVPPPSADRPNRAPAPPTLEGRVVAGDTITVSVPDSGSDPDGDSTTLAGLSSAPRLGRVLAVTPSTITYQAYPTTGGTDDFTYLVADRYGNLGTGTVRIAVAPPGDPQPVVAVDDEVTVAPGATVTVDALANDIQPIGERATVQPLESGDAAATGDARLDPATGRVTVTGPAADQPLVFVYTIVGASGEPSTATVTVRGRAGVNLPPVPRNALAQPEPGASSVDVDLLAGAVDPDSPGGALRVTRVFNAPAARIDGGVATLPVKDTPQVLSFEVVDAGGAAALGLVHVPAGGSGAPSVRPDALVRVDRDDSTTVELEDVVLDPAGRELTLTTSDQLAASPAGKVRVEADGPSRLVVTGLAGYVGPAAIAFEVTTGTAPDDPAAKRAFLTVPVQVGPETPVLRCPPTAVDVIVGGTSRPLTIPQLCHVWTARPETAAELRYTGRLETAVSGLAVENRDDTTLVVRAGAAAVPGSTARLLVTAEGTEAVPAVITVRVAPAQPPTMDPVVLSGVRAGTTRTVNIRPYLRSQLGDPEFSVVRVVRTSGSAGTVITEGPTNLSVTPAPDARGRITFAVTVTDVGSADRTDRQATGTLVVDVLGTPDAPGPPAQTGPTLSRSARLTWTPPNDNGLPVEAYEVRWPGGSQLCSASPCLVTDLENATPQRFTVRARNAAGWGPESRPSAPVTPDEVPGAPVDPRVTDPQNRSVTVAWGAAPTQGSAVTSYLVTWPGGRVETSSTSITAGGLDNSLPTQFTIRARNTAGFGPPATVEGQSAGTPSSPDAPRLESTEVAGGARQAVVVSWTAVPPNGPGTTEYTVTRSGPGGTTQVCRTASTRCDADAVENDGSTYEYRVVAANPFFDSAPSAPTSLEAVGTPGDFSGLSAVATGADRSVRLRFTSPAARDDSLTITCRVSGTACGSWSAPSDPTPFDEVVTVPANGSDYTITLTATNGGGLSSGARVDSDVVYGPLGAASIEVVSTVGPYVTFTVRAEPNGRPADVAVSVTGGVAGDLQIDDRTGGGSWTQTYTRKVGYAVDLGLRATLTRGSDSAAASGSAATRAGTLTASAGDPPGDGQATLVLTAANLSPSRTLQCVVDEEGTGGTTTVTLDTDADGNGTRAVPASELTATSGTQYTITCDDGAAPETPVRETWVAP